MAEIKLDGGSGARRSMWLPVALALLILAAAGAWFARVYVHAAVTGSVVAAKTYPVHAEYKPAFEGGTKTIGASQTEDALYVVTEVALTNRSDVPLFLSSFHGSFTMEDGTVMEASVIERDDLPRLMKMFPAIKTLADATGMQPLLRDQAVAKNNSARGYVVMYYNVPQSVWDKRKAADASIEFYHQDKLTLPLPK